MGHGVHHALSVSIYLCLTGLLTIQATMPQIGNGQKIYPESEDLAVGTISESTAPDLLVSRNWSTDVGSEIAEVV